MSKCFSFSPVEPDQAQLMILGTMPSVASLQENFYYAHARNAFWPILENYFDIKLTSVHDKKTLLCRQGIFLWDVLQSCDRPGSLDSAIKNPVANNFESTFKKHPQIKTVFFNGKAAESLFKKQVLKIQSLPEDIFYEVLPSTSPANARLNFERKKQFWIEKLNVALGS